MFNICYRPFPRLCSCCLIILASRHAGTPACFSLSLNFLHNGNVNGKKIFFFFPKRHSFNFVQILSWQVKHHYLACHDSVCVWEREARFKQQDDRRHTAAPPQPPTYHSSLRLGHAISCPAFTEPETKVCPKRHRDVRDVWWHTHGPWAALLTGGVARCQSSSLSSTPLMASPNRKRGYVRLENHTDPLLFVLGSRAKRLGLSHREETERQEMEKERTKERRDLRLKGKPLIPPAKRPRASLAERAEMSTLKQGIWSLPASCEPLCKNRTAIFLDSGQTEKRLRCFV